MEAVGAWPVVAGQGGAWRGVAWRGGAGRGVELDEAHCNRMRTWYRRFPEYSYYIALLYVLWGDM